MTIITTRIDQLERSNRRLIVIALTALMAAFFSLFVNATHEAVARAESVDRNILKVRQLEILDENDVVRVRIGGDLPDPPQAGDDYDRGQKVAGVMLYDGEGLERGGYVTFEPSGNIGLTLDTKSSQVALFAAGPNEGATIQLFNENDMIDIRSDSEGTRITNVVDGKVVTQSPVISMMNPEACSEYTQALKSYPHEQVLNSCTRRYLPEVCDKCLR